MPPQATLQRWTRRIGNEDNAALAVTPEQLDTVKQMMLSGDVQPVVLTRAGPSGVLTLIHSQMVVLNTKLKGVSMVGRQ